MKMTIHEALAKIKLFDKRIGNGMVNEVIVANRHNNEKINGLSIKETEEKFKANFQSMLDLIENRRRLKNAIAMSNAVTKIEIGGKTMTIVEAIEEKHFCEERQRWIQYLLRAYNSATQKANMENEKLPTLADEFIKGMYSNMKDNKEMSEEVKKARADYIASHTYELVDPNKLGDKIKEMQAQIEDFNNNIDFKLSESNATTVIEVDLVGQ